MRNNKLRVYGLPDSPEIARIFCKQTRIGVIPTRKADPNIFLIAPKQDYTDAQYVKLFILCDLFPFSMFYCANEGKMFKNLIILKESTLLDVMWIKLHDLLLNMTCHSRITTIPCGIPLRILNLSLAHNSLRLVMKSDCKPL